MNMKINFILKNAELEALEKNEDWATKKATSFMKECRMFSNVSTLIDAKFILEINKYAQQLRVQDAAKNDVKISAADAEDYLYQMDMNNTDEITIKEGFGEVRTFTRNDVLKVLTHLNKN